MREAVRGAVRDAAHDVANDVACDAVRDVAQDALQHLLSTLCARFFCQPLLSKSVRSLAAQEGWLSELRKCISHHVCAHKLRFQAGDAEVQLGVSFRLESCDFRAGAARAHFAHDHCCRHLEMFQPKLRDRIRALLLCLKNCDS